MSRMVHLVSVHDEFHARVIAARLGSDGIITEPRPPLGGPYPLVGEVRLYVEEEDEELARALLRADEDQPGLTPDDTTEAGDGADAGRWGPLFGVPTRLALAALVAASLLALALSRAG